MGNFACLLVSLGSTLSVRFFVPNERELGASEAF